MQQGDQAARTDSKMTCCHSNSKMESSAGPCASEKTKTLTRILWQEERAAKIMPLGNQSLPIANQRHRQRRIFAGAQDGVIAIEAGGNPAVAIVERIVNRRRARQLSQKLHVAVLVQHVLTTAGVVAAGTSRPRI